MIPKLLWYTKKKCNGQFVNCHTRNGDIYAQSKDAQGKDDKFFIIKSPEDLFKHGIDVEYSVFNDGYLRFPILQPLVPTSAQNCFSWLTEDSPT